MVFVKWQDYLISYFESTDLLDDAQVDALDALGDTSSAVDTIKYAVWWAFESKVVTLPKDYQAFLFFTLAYYLAFVEANQSFTTKVLADLKDWMEATELPPTEFINPFPGFTVE